MFCSSEIIIFQGIIGIFENFFENTCAYIFITTHARLKLSKLFLRPPRMEISLQIINNET